ncbi:hypothetical protein HK405_008118, partial [Cladochytrium tenue]
MAPAAQAKRHHYHGPAASFASAKLKSSSSSRLRKMPAVKLSARTWVAVLGVLCAAAAVYLWLDPARRAAGPWGRSFRNNGTALARTPILSDSGNNNSSSNSASLSLEIFRQRRKLEELLAGLNGGSAAAAANGLGGTRRGALFHCNAGNSEAGARECAVETAASALVLRKATAGGGMPAFAFVYSTSATAAAARVIDAAEAPPSLTGDVGGGWKTGADAIAAALLAVPLDEVLLLHAKTTVVAAATSTDTSATAAALFDLPGFRQHGFVAWAGVVAPLPSLATSAATATAERIMREVLLLARAGSSGGGGELALQEARSGGAVGRASSLVPAAVEPGVAALEQPALSMDVMLVRPAAVRGALVVTAHLSAEVEFFSQFLSSPGEFLYWGFAGSRTAFFQPEVLPFLVGRSTAADWNKDAAGVFLDDSASGSGGSREQFCGHSLGYALPRKGKKAAGAAAAAGVLAVRRGGVKLGEAEPFGLAVSLDSRQRSVEFVASTRKGAPSGCLLISHGQVTGEPQLEAIDLKSTFTGANGWFSEASAAVKDENLIQKIKARRFKSSILPFEAAWMPEHQGHEDNPSIKFARQAKRGTRGVVLTGSGRHAHNVIMTTLLLRKTGCNLPVEFLYVGGQVHEVELQWIRHFNITTVNFGPLIEEYSGAWGREEWRLGAAKVFSILASSFEEVLFLDPDNYVLRDPTYLFETRMYRKHGSIFWPDFPIRRLDLAVWDVLEMKGRSWRELEFETGQIVINKRASWRGLMMTLHLSAESNFYFRHFLGDKEAFFWGYASSQTPYFLSPNYIHSVGLVVNDEFPKGNTKIGVDFQRTRFCGLSMLQSDFHDTEGAVGGAPAEPRPLFMHWNMLKRHYRPDTNYFQSAMTYDFARGVQASDVDHVNYYYVGRFHGLENCLIIKPLEGVKIRLWDWNIVNPGYNERFHEAYAFTPGLGEFYKDRWQNFAATIPPFSYEQTGTTPKKRGIVLLASNDVMHSVVRTIL